MVKTNSYFKQHNRVYLHNDHITEDSLNETNIQQLEAHVGNSDDDFSEWIPVTVGIFLTGPGTLGSYQTLHWARLVCRG